MENVFSKETRKASRTEVSINGLISDTMYNLILGGVILYGLVVNVLMCRFFPIMKYLAVVSPTADMIGSCVLMIAGIFIAYKSSSPLISFLGYNMVVFPLGITICTAVLVYGGMDSPVVTQAFIYTALATIVMVAASALFPGFFSKIGGFLFFSLIALILARVLGMLLPGVFSFFTSSDLSYVSAAIFSLYIGYDMYKAQSYSTTVDHAVDSAVDIYMDIALLFLHLLEAFGSDN